MLQWLIATINWRLWSAIKIYTLRHDNSPLCVCLSHIHTHTFAEHLHYASIWKSMVIWKRSLLKYFRCSLSSYSWLVLKNTCKIRNLLSTASEKSTLQPTFDISDMELIQTFSQHNRGSFHLFHCGTLSKYKSSIHFHYHSIILNFGAEPVEVVDRDDQLTLRYYTGSYKMLLQNGD